MARPPRVNPDSREWRLVEEWVLKRLHDARRQLEAVNTDERSTLVLRGRVVELRELLKLGQPGPDIHEDDDDQPE